MSSNRTTAPQAKTTRADAAPDGDCPKARQAREEAAAWYAKTNSGRMTNSEVTAFFDWRSNSLNDAEYTRLESLGTGLRAVADDPRLRAIAEAAARRPQEGRLRAALASRPRAIAASCGAVLAAGLVAALVIAPPGQQTYSTQVGERRAITLADGSTIELNTDSRVRVKLTKARRDLVLVRGQAMFAVAHDPGRPFIVTAGDTSVRAIGTRFEVYRTPGAVRVILAEGRVQVSRSGAAASNTQPAPPVILTAGQRLDVSAGRAPRPAPVDVATALGWTDGRLTFQDTPLAEAVAEINRYSRGKVVLGPDAPAHERVNGVFDAGDTEAFVTGVGAALDLKSDPRPDGGFELRAKRDPA
jgi:transmembrane sensor